MLFKKMLRDFKDNKGPFISVFLLCFLAMFLFAGIAAEYTGLEDIASDLYNDTNMPMYWIYSDNFNQDTIDDIRDIEGVESLNGQVVLQSVANLDDDPKLMLHFLNGSKATFVSTVGKPVNLSDDDGVWLDKRFADERNLTVGDEIEFKFNGFSIKKTIRGLGYSGEYVYQTTDSIIPDHYRYGYAYLAYDSLPGNMPIDYNVLLVDVDEAEISSTDDFTSKLDDSIGDEDYSSVINIREHPSVKQFDDEIVQHKLSASVFVIFFLFISVLVLLTTMKRIINNQRTQIGILKALGYSKRKIILHYMSYGFYLPLLGGILGLIIGPIYVPPIFYMSMPTGYTMPRWVPGFRTSFLLVLVIIVLASLIISYMSVSSIAKESPASTLTLKAPKISKSNLIEKSRLFKSLNFTSKWILRDMNRNKLRTIVSIIGVIGCVLLLFASFGMNDSMEDLKEWKFEKINSYQTQLTLEENITDSQLDSLVDDVDGVEVYEGSIEIKANNIKKSGTISVHNETELINPTDSDWNKIDLKDDGVAISEKMADLLGVSKGDAIKWHLSNDNNWYEARIDDIYSDPVSQGLIMSPAKFESFGDLNFTPNQVFTAEDVDKNYTGVSSVISSEELQTSYNEMTESMTSIMGILIVFAIILAIVILYNLGVMSYTETERELATLKVLGFNKKSLRRIIMLPNIWYAILGFVLGIIPAYYVVVISMATTGESFSFPVRIHLFSVVITFVINFVVTIIVGYMVSRKLNRLDMVESLKSKE